ncbi:MAG: hypothetical protein AB7F72_04480 [Afipia sp.]
MSGNHLADLLYRFIAHYKWEPQHLRGSMEEFDERLRRQEVPLNFLLNALFRYSSSETISFLLQSMGCSVAENFELKFPRETAFTQPDVLIESDDVRVFIEVKVDSRVDLQQIQKYLLLHAFMDAQEKKKPVLLLLTKSKFPKCWSPPQERSDLDIRSFLSKALNQSNAPEFRGLSSAGDVLKDYDDVRSRIVFGESSWNEFGGYLRQCVAKLKHLPRSEVEVRVIEDFIVDLEQRKLS